MFKFHPILKSVVWGGDRIAAYKHIDTSQRRIGESWEVSGVEGRESVVATGKDAGLTLKELIAKYRGDLVGRQVYSRFGNEFPLLVKIIDAAGDLSLQVHPDDALAARRHGCQGKTEMWYIIEADPGAQILAGFCREVNPDHLARLAQDGGILQAVRHYDAHAGDAFFLPAGTIHSIGAGNLLAEVQQTSDITYRVYDHQRRDAMGNQRPLHTDLAREALNYEVSTGHKIVGDSHPLVRCPQFTVDRISVAGHRSLPLDEMDSFVVMLCVDGEVDIVGETRRECGGRSATLRRGASVLLPACTTRATLHGDATLLLAWME